jgi:hypothetical protein
MQTALFNKHLRWLFLLLYGGLSLWQSVFAAIIVTSGASQTVPASSDSADIVFKVLDEHGNPNTSATVNLSLVNPNGELMRVGLSSYGGETDEHGQVSTRLNGTRFLGNYTVTAKLATDATLFSSTNVIVTAGPDLKGAIIVTAGASQTVPASFDSADIVFKVIDELGNPNTSARVNLSLVNPKGDIMVAGLSSYGGKTDDYGQVSTRLNGTSILGNYAITATLATDTTRFTGTNVVVTAGRVADLKVIEGDNQSIFAGQDSADIRFKLTDAFDNAVPNQVVNFTVKNPAGEISNNGLSTILATSDVNGKVTVRLKAIETSGIYTVIATLATNESMTDNTLVQVKAALPKLPSLGFGGIVDSRGNGEDTKEVSFNGGISVNGGEFEPEAVFTTKDSFVVQGIINVGSNHVEKMADIIVVASYKPLPPAEAESFYMLDNLGVPKLWEGDMSKLEALKSGITLSEAFLVVLYEGQLTIGGRLRFFFGFRLDDGVIVFNAVQTINARIRE